jgi:Ricin-type beta-trefoil lectin domain/Domain of unknown function (DUF5122) beta-propeller
MRRLWRSPRAWPRPRLASAFVALVTIGGLAVAGQVPAMAGTTLPSLVSATPVGFTPTILAGDASTGVDSSGCSTTWFGTTSPQNCLSTVYSETVVNGEVIVGGAFTQACKPGPAASGHCTAGTEVTRDDVFAYSLSTGAIDPNFAPQLNQGPVFSVAAGPAGSNTVYLGGTFTTVNGVSQRGIAQVSVTPANAATDGQLVTAFKGHVSNQVDQIALSSDGQSLYIGGQFTTVDSAPATGLARLNATTGAVDPSFSFTLSHPEGGAALRVEAMTLSPDGSHLAIGGTFLDAANAAYDGGAAQSRPRMAVINTGGGLGSTASLSDFAAPILANNCSAEHDYVRGLDFAPDGSYVVMSATGYRSAGGPTVCDAVSRYDMTSAATASTGTADNVSPAWINFAGGDSFYAVDISGPVVYVAGHDRWVNNQCGVDSLCAPNAVLANGVAALDAHTGMALPWWEPQTARGHGTEFLGTFGPGLATGTLAKGGLLLGTDVSTIGGVFHGENGAFPLTSTAAITPGGPIPSGIFNENGGTNTGLDMCVDEAGNSATAGAAVQLVDCNNSPEQNWTVAANGTIGINGLCLDTKNGATSSGTQVVAATCDGAGTQQWAQGTGNSVTNAGAPGLCLDDPNSSTASNVNLDIAACNGGASQAWPLPAAQAPPAGSPTGPVFSPLLKNSNEMCMDDSGGGTVSGTKVDIYVCNGSASQAWTVGPDGTIQVHGLCLSTTGGGTASGTSVDLETCNGSNSQVWTPGSSFSLVNKATVNGSSKLCLTDPGSSKTNGTQLTISACNGGSNEQWRLPAL